MDPAIIHRKGARKVQDIPIEVLKLLNEGKIETVNLTEWLAIDHCILIERNFPELRISRENIKRMTDEVKALKKPSAMNTTKAVGTAIYELCTDDPEFDTLRDKIGTHSSDAIRCYAPYLISLNQDLRIEDKLHQSERLVSDAHFGVREVVWMALRPEIERNLDRALKTLTEWAKSEDENIRRFTTESTRPRGVWCSHIERLKENPEIALPILDALKSDPSKYVQDSVGNWLNDASKSQPHFVSNLCNEWQKTSPTKETNKIIKRARRTIDKN